ncbi:MAG: SAM-dependent DNA methyltransferase [Ferrovum myxofaciens]|nr:class I SAM-dependent DNA methyltransferase [Ferrovum myxofaciens]QWY75251.1 MAG: SAM-dependent DNA methyltransferase [Ferrovum myxofaciens]
MTETEFKKLLWDSANKLRGAMSAAEYKFPVLGLVFLKYVSDIFDAQREVIHYRLAEPDSDLYMPKDMREDAFLVLSEDRDAYKQDNVFWIPQEARFSELLKQAANPNLGKLLDDGMAVIERENEKLRGVLYRDFARLPLEAGVLGDLMNIVARMKFNPKQDSSRDVFGEVYEYFLGNFALSEGQRAGQFYTPRSVVSVLVEILAPFAGRIYDPACGSGGMFVYSERFIEAHGGKKGQASIYGQELSATTRKLACMNLAIRGIDYDMGKAHGDTFHNDQHPDLRADFVLANPPFNIKGWGADKLPKDPRWKYGVPPDGNANYAWLQHMLARLSADGRTGIVLANGSLTTNTSGEGDIRASMVKGDVVECMVSLPGQLFANTQIPACLWFLSKNKGAGKNGKQDRRGTDPIHRRQKTSHPDPRFTQTERVFRRRDPANRPDLPQLERDAVGRERLRGCARLLQVILTGRNRETRLCPHTGTLCWCDRCRGRRRGVRGTDDQTDQRVKRVVQSRKRTGAGSADPTWEGGL